MKGAHIMDAGTDDTNVRPEGADPTGVGVAIDICICTYRRESLTNTLRSLAGQRVSLSNGEQVAVRVIVADNDDTPSARGRALAAAADLDLFYLHAPARNISIARNAALEAGGAKWIAWIDDDETASDGWLQAILDRAIESGADVVLGPVEPVYPPQTPAWIRAGNFHATRPVWVAGEIVTGYTCNALVRRESIGTQRFDPALGCTGGEDTEFFARLKRAGARFDYAALAVVREGADGERLEMSWLLRRQFRSGQTHARLLINTGAWRPAAAFLAGLKFGACAMTAVAMAPWQHRRARWVLRAALHAGVVARLAGRRDLLLYGG